MLTSPRSDSLWFQSEWVCVQMCTHVFTYYWWTYACFYGICGAWHCTHSWADYHCCEEFFLLGYDTTQYIESKLMLRRNMLPHSSWSKNKLLAKCFMLIPGLSYSSALKIDVTCSSETLVDFQLTTHCYITLLWEPQIIRHCSAFPTTPLSLWVYNSFPSYEVLLFVLSILGRWSLQCCQYHSISPTVVVSPSCFLTKLFTLWSLPEKSANFCQNFICSNSNPSLPLSCRVHVMDLGNAGDVQDGAGKWAIEKPVFWIPVWSRGLLHLTSSGPHHAIYILSFIFHPPQLYSN
jgi:hypothetical protein